MIKKSRTERHIRIKERIRKKIAGTAERPRLTIYRSLHHFYAQVVDDAAGRVIASASTLSKDLRDTTKTIKGRKDIAKAIGIAIGRKVMDRNVKQVVFDRNGYLFHGVIKSFADGVRETGLKI